MNWVLVALGLLALAAWLTWVFVRSSKKRKTSEEVLEEEELKKIYSDTIALLSDQRYFLNKSVKLSDLASELGQNDRMVSKAINMYSAGNFNKFINTFRIEHSKDMLGGGEFDHYTIEAIADESGFSNKVSFYHAFKSHVGISPVEYKKVKQLRS